MTPPTSGLAISPRRLVTVVLRPGGEARRAIRAPLTDDARYGLVAYLANLGAEIVTAETLIRSDQIVHHALAAGLAAWAAPDALVAAMLARLPRVPFLRAHLRRLTATPDMSQLPLL